MKSSWSPKLNASQASNILITITVCGPTRCPARRATPSLWHLNRVTEEVNKPLVSRSDQWFSPGGQSAHSGTFDTGWGNFWHSHGAKGAAGSQWARPAMLLNFPQCTDQPTKMSYTAQVAVTLA